MKRKNIPSVKLTSKPAVKGVTKGETERVIAEDIWYKRNASKEPIRFNAKAQKIKKNKTASQCLLI